MFEEVKEKIYGIPAKVDPFSWEGKADLCKWFEDLCSVLNSVGMCFSPVISMLALRPTQISDLLSVSTEKNISAEEMMKAGERIFNLLRAYKVRGGLARRDDDWPQRFYHEALPQGPSRGMTISRQETDKFLDEYYEVRGWDQQSGIPALAKLNELGLGDIGKELLELGKLAKMRNRSSELEFD